MNNTIIDICMNCNIVCSITKLCPYAIENILHIWMVRNKYVFKDNNDNEFGESLIRDIAKINYELWKNE